MPPRPLLRPASRPGWRGWPAATDLPQLRGAIGWVASCFEPSPLVLPPASGLSQAPEAPSPVVRPLRLWVLAATTLLGVVIFLWRLGSSGLVDETPPLFAAAARAMAESGDWLIPRVNGLPRYDKPPLVYWAMGFFYALPGQEHWNPLGTWAARLPSALASISVMLGLAQTLLRWPQQGQRQALTALAAALAFALSPLVLLWGRIAVSDALFSGCLAWSLLLSWRAYAGARRWWACWLVLGLAVLAKGPVALILFGLTLALFGGLQRDWRGLVRKLKPLRGLLITALVALPWYGLAVLVEGEAFVASFFGYHNLQRFTVVVNHHLQPWWFFGPVLVIASLPFTPLLLLGLAQALAGWRRPVQAGPPALSLQRFAACWLLAVLLFFTLAATKLPSYWIPATPAAGLLVALTAPKARRWAWGATVALAGVFCLAWAAAPSWLPLIHEPEMPALAQELLAAGWLPWASGLYGLAVGLALLGLRRDGAIALLGLQLPLVAFVPLALMPAWQVGDQLRGLPVRQMAQQVLRQRGPQEPLAMVGIMKPSLHYYGRQVVLYEGAEPVGLINLADRLAREGRQGLRPSAATTGSTVLLVIDQGTAALLPWRAVPHQQLASQGLYRLWRIQRTDLQGQAELLLQGGQRPDWDLPRPERY
ncbi:glycosyltransferase family 39 protein [Cyanobium sp. WAJ14-Wanaka]|nr:glycosyltransferase family 39 protein [Cyanobium sp. WAJ14-Wanaka]